ncbi:MAG: amidohydrolase [Chloroflexi bacterium]|nr:MAG: amidohydrolase [Chloroflexota bacterium]MBL1192975.1 amidohydrolase [Chloroflexota bacterium]NOH10267.1 amidohydrolase [Chloroflexota bacterium]
MISYLAEAEQLKNALVEWRRDFHRHPELRFQEVRTAGKIAEHLNSLGFEVQTGIGKTGVVGVLSGHSDGPVLLLRFDMDALPIQEENQVEYISQKPGVMHACGHDAHMAIGMGVAQLVASQKEQLQGTVKLVFQPAEEGAGGALAMIEDGVLQNPVPDYSFGLHVESQRPSGTVWIGEGPILAAADAFWIILKGRGGHGALPETADDVLMAGVQIVNNVQTILTRDIGLFDSAVISICSFQAGNAFNIIPEKAEISGTIRTYENTVKSLIHERLQQVVEHTSQAFGVSGELKIDEIVPATVNNPEITAVVRNLAAEIVGENNLKMDYKAAPSDDVAEFLRANPGCHVILGAGSAESYPHHSSRFEIDEDVLPIGVALFCNQIFHFTESY